MLTRRRAVILALLASGPFLFRLKADESIRMVDLPERASLMGSHAAYVPGEVIVRFTVANEESMAERAIRDVGGVRAQRAAFADHYLVTLEPGVSVEEAVTRFRSMPEVDYAEPNGVMYAFGVPATLTPNDRLYSSQWNFKMLDVERMWGIQQGDPSVVVAVVDTGIAYEDFGPYRKAPDWGGTAFVQGYNFFTGTSHANDDNFHGTHVASTIAEATNNGTGVAGLAFKCSLMPVKVLDRNGDGSFFGVAQGIDYATNFNQNGLKVKVINMSLGGDSSSETMRLAVNRAVAAGIVVVAAAGNDNRASLSFPASLPNVIAVGAVDARKQRARYSNYGAGLSVVAPGGDLRRDDDGDGFPDGVLQQTFNPSTAANFGRYDDFAYFYVNGTSQAAPHVAALAALLVTQGIKDPVAVQKAIESTAEDLGTPGRDDQFGYGLIRPVEALKGLGLNK